MYVSHYSPYRVEPFKLRCERAIALGSYCRPPFLHNLPTVALCHKRAIPTYVIVFLFISYPPILKLRTTMSHWTLVLSCASHPDPQIRIIINDGVSPLTSIEGCPEQKDGMCSVDAFVASQKKIISETDWKEGCYGDWEVPSGSEWNTTTGDYPKSLS